MSQMNSFAGFYNLPAQASTGGTEQAYLVPAAGAYPGLPSPIMAAAVGLVISVPADLTANGEFDGNPFRIHVQGKVVNHASQNWTLKIYQVPATIVAAGTQKTLGNDHVIASSGALSVTAANDNFDFYADMCWDSVSQNLNAVVGGRVGPTIVAAAAQSPVTSVKNVDLNFLVTFTASSGTTADSFGAFNFLAERL